METKSGTGRVGYPFIAKATMVVLVVWALAQALWMVRDILFITFAAMLLALLFSMLVEPAERVMPRWLASLIALLLFLALIAGFWLVAWPQLESQVTTIREAVPRVFNDVADWVQDQYDALMPGAAAPAGANGANGANATVQDQIGQELVGLVGGALPLLNTAVGAVTGIIVTLFAAVFLVLAPERYLNGFLHLTPPRVRDRLGSALREVGTQLKRWIGGMSLSMLIIFVLSTGGLWLLGIPAPLVLGLIAGVLVFIPFIGPIISAIPALGMALTVSPRMALWVLVLYIGIQLVESNFLTPMVMREAVRLEPATTILFQMAMGVLFGFAGLALAVPLLAALQLLVKRLYVDPMEERAAQT